MTVLLDVGSKSATAVISGGGLHLSAPDNAYNGARADTSVLTGLLFFEVDCTGMASLDVETGFGVCKSATPNYHDIAHHVAGNGAVAVFRNGAVHVDGTFIAFVSGIQGNMVMCCLDLDNSLVYFRVNGGNWNNIPGADPCTQVSGIDTTAVGFTLAGLAYPVGLITSFINSLTFNFGATTTFNTPPPCATSWDGSVTPPPPPPARHLVVNAIMPAIRNSFTGTSAGGGSTYSMRQAVLASTERGDVMAGTVGVNVGVTMAVTEANDTMASVGAFATNPHIADGDYIYGPPHENVLRVVEEFSLRFVIPSEDRMHALPFTEF